MTATQRSYLHLPQLPEQRRSKLKLAASGLLSVPIVLLILLATGEMAGGDAGGAQHLVQAAPLLLIVVLGWRYPRATGIALMGLTAFLFVAWLAFVLTSDAPAEDTPLYVWVGVGFVLFLPPAVAGWLYIQAAARSRPAEVNASKGVDRR